MQSLVWRSLSLKGHVRLCLCVSFQNPCSFLPFIIKIETKRFWIVGLGELKQFSSSSWFPLPLPPSHALTNTYYSINGLFSFTIIPNTLRVFTFLYVFSMFLYFIGIPSCHLIPFSLRHTQNLKALSHSWIFSPKCPCLGSLEPHSMKRIWFASLSTVSLIFWSAVFPSSWTFYFPSWNPNFDFSGTRKILCDNTTELFEPVHMLCYFISQS